MSERTQSTQVVSGSRKVSAKVMRFFRNVKQTLDIYTDSVGSAQTNPDGPAMAAYEELLRRGVAIRLLTRITKENIESCKRLMATIQLRHLDSLTGNFGLSDTEYLATPGLEPFNPSGKLIYSSNLQFVKGQHAIFDVLWDVATPAHERIGELEGRLPQQLFRILRSSLKTTEVIKELVMSSKEEVLILLPSPTAFHRFVDQGVTRLLETAAKKGVRVSILCPLDAEIKRLVKGASSGPGSLSITPIAEARVKNTVTMVVSDRRASIVVEERESSMSGYSSASGIAVYSTSEPTVRSNVRFFERVRDETELRDREETNKRKAELMQDIMAHDIRNYNQVALLNAELAMAQIEDPEALAKIEAIKKAIAGSSDLIEKTKTLGRIVSRENLGFTTVDLQASLSRSIALVAGANPTRTVIVSMVEVPRARVLADSLLDEAFVNLLSNSVKYTAGKTVPIEVEVDEVAESGQEGMRRFWKVTINDHGGGIPDDLKEHVTRRYLEAAKGSGLGLSIVRALIVDRYSGKLILGNRTKDDYSKGTKVEVWIPKAR